MSMDESTSLPFEIEQSRVPGTNISSEKSISTVRPSRRRISIMKQCVRNLFVSLERKYIESTTDGKQIH